MARTEPELTDAQWAALKLLLPPQRPSTGRPNNEHRRSWRRWCGWPAPARPGATSPGRYGCWKTVAGRLYRWRRGGVFERLLAEVHRRADGCGELDWLCHYVDGSVVGAHQHAAGARHAPAPEDRNRGRAPAGCGTGASRGGLSTKLHLRTDGRGRPLVLLVTRGRATRSPSRSGC
jgi:transposase